MPLLRYWQVVFYYKYTIGAVSNRRAFEIRISVALPANWDEARIRRHRDVLDFMEQALAKALERFPASLERDALQDILLQDSGFGDLGGAPDYAPITMGLESGEPFTITTKGDVMEDMGAVATAQQSLEISMEAIAEKTRSPEWRQMRGYLGSLTRKVNRLQQRYDEASESITESIQLDIIDKTGRYSNQFPRGRYRGELDWEVPE